MSAESGDDAVLNSALRDLLEAWHRTEDLWRDSARDDFGREFIQEIESRTREAVRSIKQVEALLREAERQCQ